MRGWCCDSLCQVPHSLCVYIWMCALQLLPQLFVWKAHLNMCCRKQTMTVWVDFRAYDCVLAKVVCVTARPVVNENILHTCAYQLKRNNYLVLS